VISMPLVNAKCTNCGGTLTVDASKEAAICDFCGSPYIVEKAIQNYNYYVTQNIKADNVNVTAKGEAEKERLLHNAETNMSFKDYNKAFELYRQVSEDYPDDYRGWYGMASIKTKRFNNIDVDNNCYQETSSYMNKALVIVKDNKRESIESTWNDYNYRRQKLIEEKYNELNQYQSQLNTYNQNLSKLDEERKKLNVKQQTFEDFIGYGLFFDIISVIVLYNISSTGRDKIATLIGCIIICTIVTAVICLISFGIYKANRIGKNNRLEELNVSIRNLAQEQNALINRINELKTRYNI